MLTGEAPFVDFINFPDFFLSFPDFFLSFRLCSADDVIVGAPYYASQGGTQGRNNGRIYIYSVKPKVS